MKRALLFIALCLIVLLLFLFRNKEVAIAVEPSCDFTRENLVNEIIAQKNGFNLIYDKSLETYADKRALEIVSNFSHNGFKSNPPTSDIFTSYGENLYKGEICSSKYIVNSWMSSSTHRQIILDTRYDKVGIGINQSADVVVAIFGDSK